MKWKCVFLHNPTSPETPSESGVIARDQPLLTATLGLSALLKDRSTNFFFFYNLSFQRFKIKTFCLLVQRSNCCQSREYFVDFVVEVLNVKPPNCYNVQYLTVVHALRVCVCVCVIVCSTAEILMHKPGLCFSANFVDSLSHTHTQL